MAGLQGLATPGRMIEVGANWADRFGLWGVQPGPTTAERQRMRATAAAEACCLQAAALTTALADQPPMA